MAYAFIVSCRLGIKMFCNTFVYLL